MFQMVLHFFTTCLLVAMFVNVCSIKKLIFNVYGGILQKMELFDSILILIVFYYSKCHSYFNKYLGKPIFNCFPPKF